MKESSTIPTYKENSRAGKAAKSRAKARTSPYPHITHTNDTEEAKNSFDTVTPSTNVVTPSPNNPVAPSPVGGQAIATKVAPVPAPVCDEDSACQYAMTQPGSGSGNIQPEDIDTSGYATWYNQASQNYSHSMYDPWSMYMYGNNALSQKYYDGMSSYGNNMGYEQAFANSKEQRDCMNLYASYYNQTMYNPNDYCRTSQSPCSIGASSSRRQSECGSVGSEIRYESCAQASKSKDTSSRLEQPENFGLSRERSANENQKQSPSTQSSCRMLEKQSSGMQDRHSLEYPSYTSTSLQNSQLANSQSSEELLAGGETGKDGDRHEHDTGYFPKQDRVSGSVIVKSQSTSGPYGSPSDNVLRCETESNDKNSLASQKQSPYYTNQALASYNSSQQYFDTNYEKLKMYSNHNSDFGDLDPYTGLSQPGYTSVIVDTQKYQLTNGFVH